MVLEKLEFVEISFEKLGFGEIILEVAWSSVRVTIGVLKKKLGFDGDEFWEGDVFDCLFSCFLFICLG